MFSAKKIRALTLVELLLVTCIILIIIGMSTTYFNIALAIARQTALRHELYNIRMAITHYRVMNNKFPADLAVLTKKCFAPDSVYAKIGLLSYLKPFRVDRAGNLLDPFMHKYNYDFRSGRVNAQTKGTENW